jgi:hypothetical protein
MVDAGLTEQQQMNSNTRRRKRGISQDVQIRHEDAIADIKRKQNAQMMIKEERKLSREEVIPSACTAHR